MDKRITIGIVSIVSAFTLAGCTDNNRDTPQKNETTQSESMMGMDHPNMDHSGSKEVPKGLKEAENPKYGVGSKVMITEGHMEGMKGAEATIIGAYDTIAYAVSYTPTTGGEKITNHKWVILEEIVGADEKQLAPGTEVTIEADHMEGMEDATATIDFAKETTVYMVDFTTTDGENVTNHKWVTESELAPVE